MNIPIIQPKQTLRCTQYLRRKIRKLSPKNKIKSGQADNFVGHGCPKHNLTRKIGRKVESFALAADIEQGLNKKMSGFCYVFL